ncbi:MAG TPA: hypothetical protein VK901_12305 [Nitrospiraceae bacterium]|nr:hypothetical protein [Nitrospiraceae bacterium]
MRSPAQSGSETSHPGSPTAHVAACETSMGGWVLGLVTCHICHHALQSLVAQGYADQVFERLLPLLVVQHSFDLALSGILGVVMSSSSSTSSLSAIHARVSRRLTVQYVLLRISHINFSNMSNSVQIAVCFLGMLPITLAVCLRGDDIVTCRLARLSQDLLRVDLAFCCECGSADLETCYTSKALGPHLCSICAKAKVDYGTWKETARSPMMRRQPVARAGVAAPR